MSAYLRNPDKVGLAITGASGFVYGIRVLEELAARETIVHLTISPNAKHIAEIEMGRHVDLNTGRIGGVPEECYRGVIYHHHTHVGAAPASGSYDLKAVAIVPCSMGVMGRIATGTSEDLVGRMAEVALKERRPLILTPRETPYSTIQLRNMYELSQAGAVILPATPGFYHQPETIGEMVDFVVARVLQHLGFDGECLAKGGWGSNAVSSQTYLSGTNS